MRNKNILYRVLLVTFFSFILILNSLESKAQRAKEVSLYYHYFQYYNANLFELYSGDKVPKGIGISMTSQFAKKFAWTAGINYSSKATDKDIYIYGGPGSPWRIHTVSDISFISMNLGIVYPITEKKISARFQGKLVPIYYFGNATRNTYIETNPEEETDSVNELSLGINLSFRFRLLLFRQVAVFVEPGSSYYFFGRISEYQSLNLNTGISLCF